MDLKKLGEQVYHERKEMMNKWESGCMPACRYSTSLINVTNLPSSSSFLPYYLPSFHFFLSFSPIVLDEESRQTISVKNFTSTLFLGDDDSEDFNQMSPRHRKDFFFFFYLSSMPTSSQRINIYAHASTFRHNLTLCHVSVHSNDHVRHFEKTDLMKINI